MAISLWIVLAVTAIAATLVANKTQAAADRRTTGRADSQVHRATIADRHTPTVSALVYS